MASFANAMIEREQPTLSPVDKLTVLHLAVASMPQVDNLETVHRFADGIYSRQLSIPAGTTLVSKTHARECFFLVLSGELGVYRDDGALAERITGPAIFTMPAGKRAVYAHTDVVCMTMHRLDNPKTKDLEEVEAQVIIPEKTLPVLFTVHNKPNRAALGNAALKRIA